jgi:hypothetical protein
VCKNVIAPYCGVSELGKVWNTVLSSSYKEAVGVNLTDQVMALVARDGDMIYLDKASGKPLRERKLECSQIHRAILMRNNQLVLALKKGKLGFVDLNSQSNKVDLVDICDTKIDWVAALEGQSGEEVVVGGYTGVFVYDLQTRERKQVNENHSDSGVAIGGRIIFNTLDEWQQCDRLCIYSPGERASSLLKLKRSSVNPEEDLRFEDGLVAACGSRLMVWDKEHLYDYLWLYDIDREFNVALAAESRLAPKARTSTVPPSLATVSLAGMMAFLRKGNVIIINQDGQEVQELSRGGVASIAKVGDEQLITIDVTPVRGSTSVSLWKPMSLEQWDASFEAV